MMPFLIIACALLAVLTVGSTWVVVLVVRNNEKITIERDAVRQELYKSLIEIIETKSDVFAKNEIVMHFEQSAILLQKDREREVAGLHRIIGDLLMKQEMIAGGGGSADPEDEYKETPGELKLVESG